MSLKSLIVIQSGVFAIFCVIAILLTKFVNYFEIELSISVILLNYYSLLALLGIVCVSFSFKKQTTKEMAKRSGHFIVVKFPLMTLSFSLVLMVVLASLRFDRDSYKSKLIDKYNATQGEPEDYLDRLHTKFSCCGTNDIQGNVTDDGNVFKLKDDMLTRFPRSCCPTLDKHEKCTFEKIWPTTCEAEHSRKALVYDLVHGTFLIVSMLWIVGIHFVYKNEWESLFPHLTGTFQNVKA